MREFEMVEAECEECDFCDEVQVGYEYDPEWGELFLCEEMMEEMECPKCGQAGSLVILGSRHGPSDHSERQAERRMMGLVNF